MELRHCIHLFQRLETLSVWACILLSFILEGADAEKCRKKFTQINIQPSEYDDDDDRLYTNCMWGCCYNRDTPCCTAPVSLIIGCAIGGILLITLATVIICCCWMCRRRNQALRAAASRFGGAQGSDAHQPVIYHSESSGVVDLPPYEFDAPPSYEEVMRGETNNAFKPDNS